LKSSPLQDVLKVVSFQLDFARPIRGSFEVSYGTMMMKVHHIGFKSTNSLKWGSFCEIKVNVNLMFRLKVIVKGLCINKL